MFKPVPHAILMEMAFGSETESSESQMLSQMLSLKSSAKIASFRPEKIGKIDMKVFDSLKGEGVKYLVIPGLFCSCPYFLGHVVAKNEDFSCKHLLRCGKEIRGVSPRSSSYSEQADGKLFLTDIYLSL
jgi:predicted nucleic acid-binding Zn finger protein